jgi:hypothetical protein
MANILILSPASILAIEASRGSGAANLLTRSPKEVWIDSAVGSPVLINIDLGAATSIDTVYLGYVSPPAAGAVWTITGGVAGYAETTVKASGALRAIDSASRSPKRTHALWAGSAISVRYLRISVTQPAGNAALSIGVAMVGKAWRPVFNMELGHGRRVVDTGTVTALVDGGFATVDGARKRSFSWTLGDLSIAEADALEELLLTHGMTVPLVVCEDPAETAGQFNRLHYGLFSNLKAYEREDPAKTKWAFEFEEWI